MQRLIAVLVALTAAGGTFGFTAPFWSASVVHDDGTGFVTGADVRAATGWDGATLQANAASLEFVSETGSVTTISWQCVDPSTSEVLAQRTELVTTTSRRTAGRPASLPWGTVLGFRLHGFDGGGASSAVLEGTAPNSCPAGPWTLVGGSTRTTEATGTPVLTVLHGGGRYPLALR
jgi:hypothetical protein